MSRNNGRFLAIFIVLALCVQALAAQVTGGEATSPASVVLNAGLDGGYDSAAANPANFKLAISLDVNSEHFFLISSLAASSDGKYGPELVDTSDGNFFDIYVLMEGGIGYKYGPLSASGGRLRFKDAIDSPYSLFVNSNGWAAMTGDLSYDDGFFSYDTRWIGLNYTSAESTPSYPTGFPDRGANLKTFAIHSGDMRFGFQDASIYTGRYFSAEYFLSPLPQYFTQYVLSTGGRPWVNSYDDNYIMGAFFELKRADEYYFYAQLLIDDFGIPGVGADNPQQMAYSTGGRLETSLGSFGLYAAMATKYTFSSSQSDIPYGYTYYPETRFDIDRQTEGFQSGEIGIEENQIGYKYGANNLAIQADWRNRLRDFDLDASLEFRLAGENGPANPWCDLNAQDTSHWLDDAVLEKRILASVSASRNLGDWRLFAGIIGGVAFDALELRAPDPLYASETGGDSVWLYAPVAGKNVAVLKLRIGASYSWKVR
jgi:hypothetical protein